mmetsp:Transcript_25117/g.45523  ORF Transcript_25117/g.45523 Transcript_25117/m.45523 type:complete len:133 (+) Transcript_25117:722-1120(+)
MTDSRRPELSDPKPLDPEVEQFDSLDPLPSNGSAMACLDTGSKNLFGSLPYIPGAKRNVADNPTCRTSITQPGHNAMSYDSAVLFRSRISEGVKERFETDERNGNLIDDGDDDGDYHYHYWWRLGTQGRRCW